MASHLHIAEHVALPLFGRCQTNNFVMWDEWLIPYAEGAFAFASLLNHACRPNCTVMYDKARLQVRSLSHIQPGETLTICYVDAMTDRAARRQQLRSKYYFDCDCQQCQQPRMEPSSSAQAAGADRKKQQPLDNSEPSISLTVNHMMDVMRQYLYHVSHQMASEWRDKFAVPRWTRKQWQQWNYEYDASLASQSWSDAMDAGLRLGYVYLTFYVPHHPLTGLHFSNLATVCYHAHADPSRIALCAQIAKHNVSISHGTASHVYQSLLQNISTVFNGIE
jgi:hypothetical protein